ncbi:MAG: hypothetical protein AB7G87_03300 [Clostridia bacterium]
MDFCKCGSILINEKCSNEHCPSKSQKLKDWVVDGKTMDFKKPVSYEQAAKLAKKLKMKEKKT